MAINSVMQGIADRIRTIMVADTRFSDVNLTTFILGVAPRVPAELYPNVEIVIGAFDPVRRFTGNRAIIDYQGAIRFYIKLQDILDDATPAAIDVESYNFIMQLAFYALSLLDDNQYSTLNDLTGTNWAVNQFQILGGAFDIDQDRANNFENFVAINFSCWVKQTYPMV